MANYCENSISIWRIDWEELTQEQRELFLRKTYEPQTANVDNMEMPNMRFDLWYAVPIDREAKDIIDERYNKWWTKWISDIYVVCDNWFCIEMDFGSAWAPPHEWLKTLMKEHPELWVTLEYDEPGMCFQWEMWRNIKWELFDIYREWDEYLSTCSECWYHLKDTKYREDAEDLLCDKCYDLFLKDKKWGE